MNSAHGWLVVIAWLSSAAVCLAQDQPTDASRSARVSAAIGSAIESLRAEVGQARITSQLTVSQFLDRTDSRAELARLLESAKQIGGPRWLDDQTCQVRLELDGRALADALVQIAHKHPDRSPLPPEVLGGRLDALRQRTFTATGTSTTIQRVTKIRPAFARDAWVAISDDARAGAIAAAKQDAVARTLRSIEPVEVKPGLTLADVLNDPRVAGEISTWLADRPVTRVDYRPDLTVELRTSVGPDELVDQIERASAMTFDDAARTQISSNIAKRLSQPTVGRARATRDQDVAGAAVLPAQPPRWVGSQLEGEGIAPAGPEFLQTQRMAKEKALADLRARIGALALGDDLTISHATVQDPSIATAIDRAMFRARVYKVEWQPDGSAKVRVSLDSRELWNEITGGR